MGVATKSCAQPDYPLAGVITAPVPFYQQWVLAKAKTNALGFAYNAKLVLSNIDLVLSSYRKKYNTAASQVDIVAHSMGGVVTRTLENLPGYRAESYAAGTINKLITIGTPHLGSPIATQIMEDENICPRGIMALMENISLISATVDGSPVNGAMLDLRGDGWGGGLSPVLLELKGATHLPTALIAGEMSSTNLNGLNAWDSPSRAIVAACPGRLANSMTADGWPTIFGQPSDAIVPRASQLANFNSDVTEIASLIHSQGVAKLGFSGPYELEQAGTVPATVINLLNLSSQAAKFHPLY